MGGVEHWRSLVCRVVWNFCGSMRRPCLCLVDVALFSLPLEPQLLTPRFWVRGFGACFQPCRGEEAETRSCTFHLTMLSTVVSTDGAFQRLAAELFVYSCFLVANAATTRGSSPSCLTLSYKYNEFYKPSLERIDLW